MTNDMKCCGKSSSEKSSKCCGGGSKLVILPIILVVVAVGVYSYISTKKDVNTSKTLVETAKIEKKTTETNPVLATETNPVLARVNGEEIKRLDVLNIINSMPAQMKQIPIEQLFPMALEQLVNNNIIDKSASKAGLDNDDEVLEKLEQAKLNIIRSKFLDDAINEKITEERIKNKYDEYVKTFPEVEEVRASHILVDEEKKAKEIISKLKKGAKFADLAKENSKDGSSENGGDLGYFTKEDVVPEFAKAAFLTKVGEYTKSPVKSDFGYHIIKIEDKRIRQPAEFAQIKPYIEQELRRMVIGEVLEDLKVGVNIERFDINGKPLPDKKSPKEIAPAAGDSPSEKAKEESSDK